MIRKPPPRARSRFARMPQALFMPLGKHAIGPSPKRITTLLTFVVTICLFFIVLLSKQSSPNTIYSFVF